MEKVFSINKEVAFFTKQNLLINLQDSQIKQTLNQPCARCLETLLESQGQLVTHETLYASGWPQAPHKTAPNTLYQNILLARKALKAVTDNSVEFIQTVPRKGFCFNSSINVTWYSAAESENSLGDVEQNEQSDGPHNKSYVLQDYIKSHITIFSKPILVVISVLSIISFFIAGYRYYHSMPTNLSNEYVFYADVNDCHLYLHNNVEKNIDGLNTLLKKYPVIAGNCKNSPYRYISFFLKPQRIYFLSCNKSSNPDMICSAAFIRT